MFEFKLPDLGEGIHEGEILKWHVAEGGAIAEDAPLVDVETDKAAVTIPSPKPAGTSRSRAARSATWSTVGSVIAVIQARRCAAGKRRRGACAHASGDTQRPRRRTPRPRRPRRGDGLRPRRQAREHPRAQPARLRRACPCRPAAASPGRGVGA